MIYDVVFLTGVCHPNSFNRAQGAYRLAHVLRSKGYKVRVIDGVGTLPASQICNMIELVISSKTKLCCISSTFFSNFNASVHSDSLVTTDAVPYSMDEWMSIINKVKTNSNAKIVVGGHKTNEFERNSHVHTYVDHYVYGYADETLPALIDGGPMTQHALIIPSSSYSYISTRYDPLDSFLPGECFTIEMQRGCMFRCSFCAYPLNGKRKGSYSRDTQTIVDELMYCYDSFGSTNFILNSDTFNDDINYLESFYENLAKTNVKFNFGINARLDLFYNDKALIDLVGAIGVRAVLFGLESSNPFSLREIGKGLPFDKVIQTLHECRNTWRNQVRMTGSYIIGLPYDTEWNIQQVYDFFVSDDCPLHGIEFDPLYVQNDTIETNLWKSEYTINAKKHGFTFEEGSISNWHNNKTPYKTFTASVSRAEEMIRSFPSEKKSTIKSAAYLHLPNNLDGDISANEKFELIFKFNNYKELNEFHNARGSSTNQAKLNAAQRYYTLFIDQNG